MPLPKQHDDRNNDAVTMPVSVPQPTVVDMIDTRSLFYDLLFGVSDEDQPMNPLEKEILEKVELVLLHDDETFCTLSALIARHWRLPGAIVKPLYEQTDSYSQVELTEYGRLLLKADRYSEISLLLASGAVDDNQAKHFCECHDMDWDLCRQDITTA